MSTKGDRYRELFAEGFTIPQIAERFGVHYAAVRNVTTAREKHLAAMRALHLRRSGGVLVKSYRCSKCRQLGHQARTCALYVKEAA